MFKQAGRFLLWFVVCAAALAATAAAFRGHFTVGVAARRQTSSCRTARC